MKQRSALVTGASEGIGRSFATQLASSGFRVVAVARNLDRLKELINELGSLHSYLMADLATSEGVEKVSKLLHQEKFDLLINNAGFATYGTFREMGFVETQKMMDVNCLTLLTLSHNFLSSAVSGDALINVSSSASFLPMPISSVYTASKSLVTSFSESVWYEEKKRGVYVMGLCPGMTVTNFHNRAGGDNKQMPKLFSQTPDQVARLGIKELKRRSRPIVISGPQKFLIFVAKFIPRKLVVEISGRVLDWGLKQ